MEDRNQRGNINSLLDQYKKAAASHGEATLNGDSEICNQEHDILAAVYRELRSLGPEYQAGLLKLHKDSNPWVRLWAASHTLEFCSERGEAILAELAKNTEGLLQFCAATTLSEWHKGDLQFP
ncbi:MAG TPA: hypothetical protein VEF04_04125 [Blastocatellia bacterium]|nr:hypothetical protein [Blastocatellia bacterium]